METNHSDQYKDEAEYKLAPSKVDRSHDNDGPIEAKLVPDSELRHSQTHTMARQATASSRGNEKLLQSKGVVLAILFLVTGALGIPLLWSNKSFSSTERLFWTVTVSFYTLALLIFAGSVCYWSYRQIMGG